MVGQASNKNKGKISRMLANKASLSVRVDALGEGEGPSIALEDRAKLEARLRSIEDGDMYKMSGKTKARESQKKYDGSRRFFSLSFFLFLFFSFFFSLSFFLLSLPNSFFFL